MNDTSSRGGLILAGSALVCVFVVFLGMGFRSLIQSGANMTRAPQSPTATKSIDPALIDSDFAYFVGPTRGRVTVVEFIDFQCPFCRAVHPTVKALIERYSGQPVKFVFRHFPIEGIHPHALDAARASMCAKEQNRFLQMHDILYEKQDQISRESLPLLAQAAGIPDAQRFASCLASRRYDTIIRKDQSDGAALGVLGTPTFFINGHMIQGAERFETFTDAIDDMLNR